MCVVTSLLALLLVVAAACSPAPPSAPATRSPATVAASPTVVPTSPPTTGRDEPLHYVALGDSLASGIGGQPSYVDEYRTLLRRSTGRPVRLTNLGRPGWTSRQLLDALRGSRRFRDAVATADVVTWDIGGNDILLAAFRGVAGGCDGAESRCLRDARRTFTSNYNALVDELVSLRRGPGVRLQTFDLYTPFVTLPGVPHEAALAELAVMNDTIRAAAQRSGTDVAPVRAAFAEAAQDRSLIAADGVHPTAAGHRLIAQLLAAQLR